MRTETIEIASIEKEGHNILDAIAAVEEKIKEYQLQDGYNGAKTDSALQLKIQLQYYKLGLSHQVPPEWKFITDKYDPEYKDYIRLKEKFGG